MAPDSLTACEIEVLRRLASGATNVAIAAELSLSVRTVERHVANIFCNIAACGRANATAYALTYGLVAPHQERGLRVSRHRYESSTIRHYWPGSNL